VLVAQAGPDLGDPKAPLEFAFAYVDDIANCDRWMFGVAEMVPVDDSPHGVGKVHESLFHLKPVKLRSKIRVAERVVNQTLVTDSVGGFPIVSSWAFEAAGPERTKLIAHLDYELPGAVRRKQAGVAQLRTAQRLSQPRRAASEPSWKRVATPAISMSW
jgi:Polyketide cyclase / dehydrase and lipid transport